MSQYTPTPWSWKVNEGKIESDCPTCMARNVDIDDTEGITIASCFDDECREEANAAFIVQACNSHEELLETLKILADRLDEGMIGQTLTLFAQGGDPNIVALARRVLAKATGKE